MEKGICRRCHLPIIMLIDRWIHAATGNSTCSDGQGEAEPK